MSRARPWLLPLLVLALAFPAFGAGDKDRKKDWEEAKKSFPRLYRSEDPAVRKKAVESLQEFADLGGARMAVEKVLARETHPAVIQAAISVVGATTDPKEVKWIVGKATGKGNYRIRAALVEALTVMKAPEAGPALTGLVEEEEDPRVLSMAIFGVAERNMKDTLPLVLTHLEHEDWQVRVAAIEALAAFGDDRALEPLIDRLATERGRLRQDIADALEEMTGRDFGRDANEWRTWLKEGKPKPKEKKQDGPVVTGTSGPTYFGLEVISDRVLFILDLSMSMKTPIKIDKMKLAREAARTGPGQAEDKDKERFEDTIQWWKIKDRLDLAKAQLKFCIKNLGKKQQFEIVTFSKEVEAWNGGRLMKATTKTKLRAIQFIDGLDVVEDTAAGAALEFAFNLAGPGAEDKNYKSGVDTMFFLSDGAPSDRNPEEILEDVRYRNRLRKIKIHVIAILNYNVKFLRLLAEQNGGNYKFIKVENKE